MTAYKREILIWRLSGAALYQTGIFICSLLAFAISFFKPASQRSGLATVGSLIVLLLAEALPTVSLPFVLKDSEAAPIRLPELLQDRGPARFIQSHVGGLSSRCAVWSLVFARSCVIAGAAFVPTLAALQSSRGSLAGLLQRRLGSVSEQSVSRFACCRCCTVWSPAGSSVLLLLACMEVRYLLFL